MSASGGKRKPRLICGRDCAHYGKDCPYMDVISYDDSAENCPDFEPKDNMARKREKDAEIIISTSGFVLDGILYEEIYDPSNSPPGVFVCLKDDGDMELVTEVKDGIRKYIPYIPLDDNDPLSTGAVKLPTFCEDYGTEKDLVREIQDHIHRYVDVSPRFERFSAWYVLLTWLYDRVNTIPYLRVLGDTGTGKSRFLDVVGGLCYKPCMVSGAVTPAPIYRMIRQWKGTIILDEADFRDSNEKNEVIKILNCGFERGRPVIRCRQNDVETLQFLPTYCPKVIATRRPFEDKALESRCLTERMIETSRKDIPDVLPSEFYEEQEELRNKLLMFRLRNYNSIDPRKIQEIDLGDIEPRLRQATRSFASLFSGIPDMLNEFRDFLRKYNEELVEERSETIEGMIVNAIFSLKEEGYERITSSDIAFRVKERFGIERITPQSVGKYLKSLGIERKRDRDQRYIIWKENLMNKLGRRYIPGFVTSVTSVTSNSGKLEDYDEGFPHANVTNVTHVTQETVQKFIQQLEQERGDDGLIDFEKAVDICLSLGIPQPTKFIKQLQARRILLEPFPGKLEVWRGRK